MVYDCTCIRYFWSVFSAPQNFIALFLYKHINHVIYILDKYFSFWKHLCFFFVINLCDRFINIDYLYCILCISILFYVLCWFNQVVICIDVGVVAVRFIWYQETFRWIIIYGFLFYNLFNNLFYEFTFIIFLILLIFLILCHVVHD